MGEGEEEGEGLDGRGDISLSPPLLPLLLLLVLLLDGGDGRDGVDCEGARTGAGTCFGLVIFPVFVSCLISASVSSSTRDPVPSIPLGILRFNIPLMSSLSISFLFLFLFFKDTSGRMMGGDFSPLVWGFIFAEMLSG